MTVVPLQAKPASRGPDAGRARIVAALDIGSTKVGCLIAQVQPHKARPGADEQSSLKILGLGCQASRGVKAGAIVDIEQAERAIRLCVDAAERMAQRTIAEVYVNVSGGRPQSACHAAVVKTRSGEVGPWDAEAAIGAALGQIRRGQRSLLHVTPLAYQLDGAKGIASPVGMFGVELGVELGVVSVEQAAMRNLSLAVERCHLGVAGYVVAPYASARSVLAEDERALGVTLIDMGGATTGVAVFHGGHLAFADVVPVGGQHITNDIARGLSTTVAHAERMKTLWGSAIAATVDEREMVAVPLLGERGVNTVHKVPKSMLTGIIRPRLEEILEMTRDRLEQSGMGKLAGRRVVLTGGGCQLTGMREMAGQWLDRQVRLGAPHPLPGMPETGLTPGFSVAAGLLDYALQPDTHYAVPQAGATTADNADAGYLHRVGKWIAESF